jgi:ribosomal protein S26
MFKAKICGSRSVEDKKKKLDFEDQNKTWTHKYSSKKNCMPKDSIFRPPCSFFRCTTITPSDKTIKKLRQRGVRTMHLRF